MRRRCQRRRRWFGDIAIVVWFTLTDNHAADKRGGVYQYRQQCYWSVMPAMQLFVSGGTGRKQGCRHARCALSIPVAAWVQRVVGVLYSSSHLPSALCRARRYQFFIARGSTTPLVAVRTAARRDLPRPLPWTW